MIDPNDLRAALQGERRVSRRLFLTYGAALSTIPSLAGRAAAGPRGRAAFPADPFTLGVASGDPSASGVVLWTRLAPKPLDPDGGLPPESFDVHWEVADDEAMKSVVRGGTAVAGPQLGHSVHVEVDGLRPDRWYWYRFRAGDAVSRVGRTRTLPAPDATPDKLRFAFASCQHYEQGLFTAYEHMAADELDLVVHLGDYIYEYGTKEPAKGAEDKRVRKHVGAETESLTDYRVRYSQYRTDPLLQAAHARCPWLVTWDDHEFDNDYANDISEEAGVDPVDFLVRRANAYQAYYEMMPLRRRSLPRGPAMRLYRSVSFGRLAEFLVLDTRQYRTDQPNGGKASDLNAATLDRKNTMLGAEQAGWLKASLLRSEAEWNVLAQQVMIAMVDLTQGADKYSMDKWTSCVHERTGLVKFLAERRVPNPVVLTGDIHTNWVNDLRVDDRKPETPVVATEFVGTSISSGGNGAVKPKVVGSLMSENPCVRFHNRQRGYVRCLVTPDAWTTDFVVVEDVTRPGAPAVKRASFAVEAGRPGAKPA